MKESERSARGDRKGGPGADRKKAIRVVVVDDDEEVRKNIATFLETAEDIQIVGMGENGMEAVRLVGRLDPDILVTDIRMPLMDGITASEQVKALYPDTKILLLTTFDDDEAMLSGLQAGAGAYLLKNTSPEDIVKSIREVSSGGTVVSPGPTSRLVKNYLVPLPPDSGVNVQFSKREMDVLRLLCQAHSNSEIAAQLYVQESTVKTHISSIMAKLEVNSRLKVVVRAYELGLVRH